MTILSTHVNQSKLKSVKALSNKKPGGLPGFLLSQCQGFTTAHCFLVGYQTADVWQSLPPSVWTVITCVLHRTGMIYTNSRHLDQRTLSMQECLPVYSHPRAFFLPHIQGNVPFLYIHRYPKRSQWQNALDVEERPAQRSECNQSPIDVESVEVLPQMAIEILEYV